jgi:hypothetical protein
MINNYSLKELLVMWWKIFLLSLQDTIQLKKNGWDVKDISLMYLANRKQNLILITSIDREQVLNYCLKNKKGFTLVDSIKRFQEYLKITDKKMFIFTIMDRINYNYRKHHVLYTKIDDILLEHVELKTVDEFYLYCCNNGIDFNEYEQ